MSPREEQQEREGGRAWNQFRPLFLDVDVVTQVGWSGWVSERDWGGGVMGMGMGWVWRGGRSIDQRRRGEGGGAGYMGWDGG